MDNMYYEPTDEDVKEFGQAATQTAWANLSWLYTDEGFLTEAGER